jgi:hypothetical protein
MLREARVEAAEARRAAETGVADDGSRAHPDGTDDVEGRRSGLSRSLEVPPASPSPQTTPSLLPFFLFFCWYSCAHLKHVECGGRGGGGGVCMHCRGRVRARVRVAAGARSQQRDVRGARAGYPHLLTPVSSFA